jgi:hypothetical protein
MKDVLDLAAGATPPLLTDDDYMKLQAHVKAHPNPPQRRKSFRLLQLVSKGDLGAKMQCEQLDARNASDKELWAAWYRTLEYNRLVREAPRDVQGDSVGRPTGEDSPATKHLEILLGEDGQEILAIARSRVSADDKMRTICRTNCQYLGWKSKQWADLLGISDSAIRQSTFWRQDRKRAIERVD